MNGRSTSSPRAGGRGSAPPSRCGAEMNAPAIAKAAGDRCPGAGSSSTDTDPAGWLRPTEPGRALHVPERIDARPTRSTRRRS